MKALIKRLLSHKSIIAPGARAIFISHHIQGNNNNAFVDGATTKADLFFEQIDCLSKYFKFVTLREVLLDQTPEPLAALTFDDGFESIFSEAMEGLQKRKIPFVIFCNKDAIEKDALQYGEKYSNSSRPANSKRLYLDEKLIKDLSNQGIEIGSHSLSHRVLSKLSAQEAESDILDNKKFLENLTQKDIPYFAIPYGRKEHFNADTIRACKKAGHTHIFTSENKYVSPGSELVPRISLHLQRANEIRFLLNKIYIRSFFAKK